MVRPHRHRLLHDDDLVLQHDRLPVVLAGRLVVEAADPIVLLLQLLLHIAGLLRHVSEVGAEAGLGVHAVVAVVVDVAPVILTAIAAALRPAARRPLAGDSRQGKDT